MIDRRTLQSTAANYPYLQGLWAVPFGLSIALAGIANLRNGLSAAWLIAVAGTILAGCGAASVFIPRYYRDHYGEVTPTGRRQMRHAGAVVAWIAVLFVGANKYLLWSPDGSLCIYASAFALATLAYYSILVGLRAHHVVIWGAVLIAGLLPVWGGLGADRDALAMLPLGIALVASGLLDHRLLVRSFRSSPSETLADRHAAR